MLQLVADGKTISNPLTLGTTTIQVKSPPGVIELMVMVGCTQTHQDLLLLAPQLEVSPQQGVSFSKLRCAMLPPKPSHVTFRSRSLYEHAETSSLSLVTQLTMTRLEQLKWLAEAWQGGVVAAIFLESDGKPESEWQTKYIEKTVRHAVMAAAAPQTWHLALHVAELRNTRYPINVLRNMAMDAATSEWILPLDVDFLPSPNLKVDPCSRSNLCHMFLYLADALCDVTECILCCD